MTIEHLVNNIPSFDTWSHADKIRFFGWYFESIEKAPRFSVAQVRGLYATLGLAPAANFSQQLAQLVAQRHLLKDREGYRTEKRVRDALEEKYGQRALTVAITQLLEDLPALVTSQNERNFLDEAIRCFRAGAFRASIVMTWNLAFFHLSQFILDRHLPSFNHQWPIRYPALHKKARIQAISKADDFAELKESEVVEIASSAAVISGDVAKILREKLDKRNSAAHPSNVSIGQLQAEAFIDDLVRNVVLKL